MPTFTTVFVLLLTMGLGACSPALNWREARIKGTDLIAMLPCKPDDGARVVPLAGRDVEMHMTGCDAAGATFAIADVRSAQGTVVPDVMGQWRTATLANMGARQSQDVPRKEVPGESPTSTTMVLAQGQRKDGTPVMMQAVWFVRGTQVFHAVVYAQRIAPDMTETFFQGLKFQ